MYKLQLLLLAIALSSAAANFEIKLAGITKSGDAVTSTISKPGNHPKGTFEKISNMAFGQKQSHIIAICGDKPNKGPTAMVFTPEISKTGFWGQRSTDVRFSSHFDILPAAQINDLCKPKDGVDSGILLTLINGWSPNADAAKKGVPTHAMLFRKPGIYAVHSGFEQAVYIKFSNKSKLDYTVYICQKKADKVVPVSLGTAPAGDKIDKKIEASGIYAVDIVLKGGKACVYTPAKPSG